MPRAEHRWVLVVRTDATDAAVQRAVRGPVDLDVVPVDGGVALVAGAATRVENWFRTVQALSGAGRLRAALSYGLLERDAGGAWRGPALVEALRLVDAASVRNAGAGWVLIVSDRVAPQVVDVPAGWRFGPVEVASKDGRLLAFLTVDGDAPGPSSDDPRARLYRPGATVHIKPATGNVVIGKAPPGPDFDDE